MKTTRSIFSLFILLFMGSILSAQPNFYLRIDVANLTSTYLEIDVMMSGSAEFALGSSNVQFLFDENAIENPTLVLSEGTDLINSAFYSKGITTPTSGKGSLNVFLFIPNFGDVAVPAFPAFTNLARIRFDIVDANALTDIAWSYTGGTTETVVFLDNETTQIFVNIPASDLVGLTSQPLPVELSTFDAYPANQEINLEWQTATEVNFKGFEIERSLDGDQFESIGWMNAQGGLSGSQYKFIDTDIRFNQTYYYRLKMIDTDGSFEYSDIRSAILNKEVLNEYSIFPNPTAGRSTLEISSTETSAAQLSVFDLKGQRLHEQNLSLEKGINQFQLDFWHLPPGHYEVIIQTERETQQQKLIKL